MPRGDFKLTTFIKDLKIACVIFFLCVILFFVALVVYDGTRTVPAGIRYFMAADRLSDGICEYYQNNPGETVSAQSLGEFLQDKGYDYFSLNPLEQPLRTGVEVRFYLFLPDKLDATVMNPVLIGYTDPVPDNIYDEPTRYVLYAKGKTRITPKQMTDEQLRRIIGDEMLETKPPDLYYQDPRRMLTH